MHIIETRAHVTNRIDNAQKLNAALFTNAYSVILVALHTCSTMLTLL